MTLPEPLPIVSRLFPPHPHPFDVRQTVQFGNGVQIGGDHFALIAGPCAVETREQLDTVADAVAGAGAAALRGGAFKPRTSPQSFQGLGGPGLELLAAASRRTGLPVVTEVLDPRDVALVAGSAAVLQIGSRNMQNFPLLREVGRLRQPVLLKRGAAATIDELLAAADYILQGGNDQVVLCERGVRGFDPSTRYLLDLTAVPVLRQRTGLPVVVDPSHGTGRAELVAPMAKAALMAGADGLLIEVHADPERALCDGRQALRPAEFAQLAAELRRLVPFCGRRWSRPLAADSAVTAAGANPGPLDDEVHAP